MSQNVEKLWGDAYDALNRGDFEACLTFMDPSIEWWPAADELIIARAFPLGFPL